MKYACSIPLICCLLAGCGASPAPSLNPPYTPETARAIPPKAAVPRNENKTVFFGDLHIHTSYSTDSYTMGVRATPEDAYRFARGGEIAHAAGYGISLQRPLDFAAVTDHSEYLGVVRQMDPDFPIKERGLRERLLEDGPVSITWFLVRSLMDFDLRNVASDEAVSIGKSAWKDTVAAANNNYIPGEFTAFVGYEWSSMPNGRNLHRNVIYRSDHAPELPFSSIDSEDPRELWKSLERQRAVGMQVMAIPHNGNVSDGLMYDSVAYDGTAFDRNYARTRMRNEPVSEIFQVKGSSETHPLLSPRDEFAGFELYETTLSQSMEDSQPKGSYIRDALRLGIELSHKQGFNPYRFGVIGSSDGHNASSPVEEDNYHGKLPLLDGSAGLRMRTASYFPETMPGGRLWSAAGLAAVWAEENTRESLFDAMRAKETYATSGTRIAVRFYAGWDYPRDLLEDPDWIAQARAGGVPMGGDLPPEDSEASPVFAVFASRDPQGANLDRVQVIKGWVDESGTSREKVYDIAWAGERSIDPETGQLPAVGNTVDVNTASYTNDIGAPQLFTTWVDPEFSAAQEAFYYVRVLEIPTPRWTTFDAVKLGIEAPEPVSLQERAVTSAIWYRGSKP